MNFSAIFQFGDLKILVLNNSQVYFEMKSSSSRKGYTGHSVPQDQETELRIFVMRALDPVNYSKEQPIFEVDGFAARLTYNEGLSWPHPNYGLEIVIGSESIRFSRAAAIEVLNAMEKSLHLRGGDYILNASMVSRQTARKEYKK